MSTIILGGEGVNAFQKPVKSTISTKGQVTIPAKVREALDAQSGDQIIFTRNENGEIVIKVVKKNALLSLFGSMPPKGDTSQKSWEEIRQQAKEEKFTPQK